MAAEIVSLRAAAIALALIAAPVAAETLDVKFRGYAYDLDTGKFIYNELHQQRIQEGRWLGGTITYFAPDGSVLGKKTLDFSADLFVPVFRLDLAARGGYSEAITAVTPDRIEMERKSHGATQVERRSIAHPKVATGDSGFHVFIREHFVELLEGKTLDFNFVVAGNLDDYRFRARRIVDTTFEDKPAVRFRVEPASWLRWLVDPLELTYGPALRRLLEYHGISNVHDPATGKAYNARIIYPSSPPGDAPALPAGY